MGTKKSSEQGSVQADSEGMLLLDNFRRRITQINRLLNNLDSSGNGSEEEREAFWEQLLIEGEELTSLFRQIVALRGGSARDRILCYLQSRVGEAVSGRSLEAVAGISAWARRIRELRVEHGYEISTSENDPSLAPGQYRLDHTEPDTRRAEWWRFQNNLRRKSRMSPYEKVLTLLTKRTGEAVDGTELSYVLKDDDWRAIITELRHAGHPIRTAEERNDLDPGQYLLEA